MTIRLTPELEALIRKDVERGPYHSADEFVAQAERESWWTGVSESMSFDPYVG